MVFFLDKIFFSFEYFIFITINSIRVFARAKTQILSLIWMDQFFFVTRVTYI